MKLTDLSPPSTPFDIEVVPGSVTFTLKPMTLQSFHIAQCEARLVVAGLEESMEQCRSIGFARNDLPDLSLSFVRDGLFQEAFVIALGKAHIIGWSGVEDEQGPAAVTEDAVSAVLRNPVIGRQFHESLTRWYADYLSAKKDSGIASPGNSGPDAVPVIVPDAAGTTNPVPAD